MGHPQRQQHMAGVQRPAGTGAPRAGADTRQVQPQQEALPLNALETEADNPGGLTLRIPVAAGIGNFAQALHQLVPHGGDLRHILLHVCAALLQRSRHGQDGRDGLGAPPSAPLLGAAFDEVLQTDGLLAVQRPHALGGVKFVTGEGQHVNVVLFHINRQMSHRLHSVRVKQHPFLPADRADLPHGLDGADLVVGEHDGHQAGILPNGGLQLLQPHQPVLVDRQVGYLKPLLLQLFQRVEYGMVFNGIGNDMLLPLFCPQPCPLGNGPVVRLSAAAGEINLPGFGVKAFGNGLPGLHQGIIGLPPLLVQRAGIAVQLSQGRKHGVRRRLADGSGSGVVGVYKHDV